jgi:hemerythrin superfamily protein
MSDKTYTKSEIDKLLSENKQLREHIKRIREAQKDKDWQMMGISIREAYDDINKINKYE